MTKDSARTWELFAGEISETSRLFGAALRRPQYAGRHGLEEYHVRNKAEELAKRHFHRGATVLDDSLREGRFEVLVVGGHDIEVSTFVEFLPRELRKTVAGTYSIDLDTVTTRDIRVSAETIVNATNGTRSADAWPTSTRSRRLVATP